jgi:hypothetical protein
LSLPSLTARLTESKNACDALTTELATLKEQCETKTQLLQGQLLAAQDATSTAESTLSQLRVKEVAWMEERQALLSSRSAAEEQV